MPEPLRGTDPERRTLPSWVKPFGLIAMVVLVLLIVLAPQLIALTRN